MKFQIIFCLIIVNSILLIYPQSDKNPKDEYFLGKGAGITDRAGNTHNASNIGLFFENRGKLYSRRLSEGPDLEFPVNSNQHYGYRTNPFVGIPGNVVQGRFTTNEEWEAVGGFHNKQLVKVAFSDNPNTWPETGWPIKDQDGNPIIKSDQDSYCVYSDSNNARGRLGLVIAQTGYAYGVNFAKNLLFLKFEIINKGPKDLDSVYFGMYFDCNVGNVSGGDPEYADDFVGFDKNKNFVWFYDDGVTTEWPSGKTGVMGLAFLKTPKVNGQEPGITDFHYNLYDDDSDIDSIQYGIMSSSAGLFNSGLGFKYFHLGGSSNLHYDDPATIPATGLDLVTYNSSGPYFLKQNDTLVFYTCFVAGENLTEAEYYLDQAYKILNFDFEISKPPVTPTLTAIPGDGKVTLYWDDAAEYSKDNFSGEVDFEGYRVYKSMDKGVTWTKLADFDVPYDKIGADKGIQYSYVDNNLINGLEYWYSVTAYDRGDSSVPSLESPRGSTTAVRNTKSAVPFSAATGRTPVSGDNIEKLGPGKCNYDFNLRPADNENLSGNEYFVGFTYTARQERGKPILSTQILIPDSSKTTYNKWGVEFVDPKNFFIYDFSRDETTSQGMIAYKKAKKYPVRNIATGQTIFEFILDGPPDTAPVDSLPKVKDLISLAFSIYAIRNGTDTVIQPRPFAIDKPQATSDGVIFDMAAPDPVKNVSRVGGSDNFELSVTVSAAASLKNETYLISVNGKGTASNGQQFVSLLVRGALQDTVLIADTVFSAGSITFNGIKCRVDFNSSSAPSPGNIYSVTTIIPTLPNIQDAYKFKIKPALVTKVQDNSTLSNIKVVPNPYIVTSLFEPEYGELRREPLRQIQFINLPTECTIYIFTLDADLIKTIYHNSTYGSAIWDLRAEGGREIAPGIYIYLVKSGGGEYLSRFAVIK